MRENKSDRIDKLILLSCATYNNSVNLDEKDFGKSSFTEAVKTVFDSSDWSCIKNHFKIEKLDDEDGASYTESCPENGPKEVDCVEVLRSARDFHLYRIGDFSLENIESKTDTKNPIKANLLFDRTGIFLIITEIEIYPKNNDAKKRIENTYKNKEIGKNLEIEEEINQIFEKGADYVSSFFKCFNKDVSASFKMGNTHPIYITPDKGDQGLSKIFSNEESIEPTKKGISNVDSGQFFHAGWNYSIATHYPPETVEKIFEVVCATQILYFLLENYKKYFYDEFYQSFTDRKSITKTDLEQSDLITSAFYDLISKTFAFRNKVFPKYRAEMDALLERWNCFDDIGWIKDNIRHSNELKEKIHQRKIEEQNYRQTVALSFIGLFQVLTIFGAISSMINLVDKSAILLSATTMLTILALALYGKSSKQTVYVASFGFALLAMFFMIKLMGIF